MPIRRKAAIPTKNGVPPQSGHRHLPDEPNIPGPDSPAPGFVDYSGTEMQQPARSSPKHNSSAATSRTYWRNEPSADRESHEPASGRTPGPTELQCRAGPPSRRED